MKVKCKRLWLNTLQFVSHIFGGVGSWMIKLHCKIATYAEDLNAKWFYTKAFVVGPESEISESLREGKELPVKPVAIVADGGTYYLVYDYEIHKVRDIKKTRVYLTEDEAVEAVKGFITTRNFARITVDEATETATLELGTKQVLKSEVRKGNGKRHIKHDKQDTKAPFKKGNGKYNKKPHTKKKVVKKVGK